MKSSVLDATDAGTGLAALAVSSWHFALAMDICKGVEKKMVNFRVGILFYSFKDACNVSTRKLVGRTWNIGRRSPLRTHLTKFSTHGKKASINHIRIVRLMKGYNVCVIRDSLPVPIITVKSSRVEHLNMFASNHHYYLLRVEKLIARSFKLDGTWKEAHLIYNVADESQTWYQKDEARWRRRRLQEHSQQH